MSHTTFGELAHENEALQMRLSYLHNISQQSLEKIGLLADTAVAATDTFTENPSFPASASQFRSGDVGAQGSTIMSGGNRSSSTSTGGFQSWLPSTRANLINVSGAPVANPMMPLGVSSAEEAKKVVASVCRSIQSHVQQALEDIKIAHASQFNSINSNRNVASNALGPAQIQKQKPSSEDDVEKAHQLAVALQEKNALKSSLMAAKREKEQLEDRYFELKERHTELLKKAAQLGNARMERQNNNAGGNDRGRSKAMGSRTSPKSVQFGRFTAAAGDEEAEFAVMAIRELYEDRIRELEGLVLSSQSELATLKQLHPVHPSESASNAEYGHAAGMAWSGPSRLVTPSHAGEALVEKRAMANADAPNHGAFGGKGNSAAAYLVKTPLSTCRMQRVDEPADGGELTGDVDMDSALNASGGGGVVSMAQLRKQNLFLKAKLEKTKEELERMRMSSVGSTEEMYGSLDVLLQKITKLQEDASKKDTTLSVLRVEKSAAAREIAQLKQQLSKSGATTKSRGRSESPASSRLSGSTAVQGKNSDANPDIMALRKQLLAEQERVATADSELQKMRSKIGFLETSVQEKELQATALEKRNTLLEEKLRAANVSIENVRAHKEFLQDVQLRLQEASNSVALRTTTDALQLQLTELRERVSSMDSMELQLRQKDDEIALLEEEKNESEQRFAQLKQTLSQMSSLFSRMPLSIPAVEQLLVQKDVYEAELRRCSLRGEVPDARTTQDILELRLIELEAKRAERGIGAVSGVSRDSNDGIDNGGAQQREFVVDLHPYIAEEQARQSRAQMSLAEAERARITEKERTSSPSRTSSRRSPSVPKRRSPTTNTKSSKAVEARSSTSGNDRATRKRSVSPVSRRRDEARTKSPPSDPSRVRQPNRSASDRYNNKGHAKATSHSSEMWAPPADEPEVLDFSPALHVEMDDDYPVWDRRNLANAETDRAQPNILNYSSSSSAVHDMTRISHGRESLDFSSRQANLASRESSSARRQTSPQAVERQSRHHRRDPNDRVTSRSPGKNESMHDEIERLLQIPNAPRTVDIRTARPNEVAGAHKGRTASKRATTGRSGASKSPATSPSPASKRRPGARSAQRKQSPEPPLSEPAKASLPVSRNRNSVRVQPSDVELLFDLFDKKKTGRLDRAAVRLCLTALGCNKGTPPFRRHAEGGDEAPEEYMTKEDLVQFVLSK